MSAVDLQNVRPMIPLQIDPPTTRSSARSSTRCSPCAWRSWRSRSPSSSTTSWTASRGVTRSTSPPSFDPLPVARVPHAPRPARWRRPSVPGHEGRDHPTRPRDRESRESRVTIAHQKATADSIYAYFNDVWISARSRAGTTSSPTFLHTEVDGHRLTRKDILDICFLFFIAGLDTVTASLDCFFAYLARQPGTAAPARRGSEHHPGRGGGAAPVESPVTTVARRSRTPSWAAVPSRPAST